LKNLTTDGTDFTEARKDYGKPGKPRNTGLRELRKLSSCLSIKPMAMWSSMKIASSVSLFRRRPPILLLAVFIAIPSLGQNPLRTGLTMGFGDVPEIKKKAEAGNAEAQVTLGNVLAAHFRRSEALGWYRKAAAQGNIDAEYYIGEMLLFGGYGDSTNAVQPNPVEGLRWTFMAATNLNPAAYYNMSRALRQGLGTSADPVAAYAWLILLSETPTRAHLARLEINEMALRISTADIERAKNLAAQFKAGYWQRPVARVIPEGDSHLKLTGVAFGMKTPQAVINGKTMSEGESATIALKAGTLRLKCLKIQKDSVMISIDGEDQPRVLRLHR